MLAMAGLKRSTESRLQPDLAVSFQGLKKIWCDFGPLHIRGNYGETGGFSNEAKRLYRSRRFRDIVPWKSLMKPDLERKVHQVYEVVGFRSIGPYTLEIKFDDGRSRQIDFEGVLEGELYGPLRDLTVFEQVKLDREAGNLVWPGGADFDPEILHDWPERKAAMFAAALRWRKSEYAARNGKASAVEAIWEGLIAFGLVQFPVNLYPATEVVRGLEVERDNLAVISDDALKRGSGT